MVGGGVYCSSNKKPRPLYFEESPGKINKRIAVKTQPVACMFPENESYQLLNIQALWKATIWPGKLESEKPERSAE
jgi:hypothetical protein